MINKKYFDLISKRLDELIEETDNYHKDLFKAAKYSVNNHGKLLRPALVLTTAEMLGVNPEIALDPACSIELIHTYSFIHDDLPSMDNDDLRRGQPTLHKMYPEWLAVLAGDYLLTYAFEVITNTKNISDSQKVKLINTLSKRAGGNGLIAGQVADLSWEGKKIDFDQLKFMHINKTASLFMCAIEFASIIANINPDEKKHLNSFSQKLGLSFQIADDILDVTSNEKTLGKPVGSDIKNDKATATAVLGIDKAKELLHELHYFAMKDLEKLSYETSPLEKFSKKLLCRVN